MILQENPNIPLEHTPGIPKPSNERNSFIINKQMVEGLGYVPGVCWKILWSKVDISQGAGSSASLLDNSMASRLGFGEKLLAESGENAKDVCIYNMYINIHL